MRDDPEQPDPEQPDLVRPVISGAVPPVFIGSEIYRATPFARHHPLSIPRVSTVMDLARALSWLPRERFITSPRARAPALSAFHSPAYLEVLQRAEATGDVSEAERERHGLGTLSNPIHPLMFKRPATSAGGALLAAERVRHGGVAHVPGAGTHHAMADRAGGFCYLNDPVLTILHLRRLGLKRVAYVDIDAHHCDGVQAGLAGASGVMLISVHEAARWPFTGALQDEGGGNCLNLPVPRDFNDTEMDHVRERLILPALEAFAPEAIVLQCGADAVTEDPLSRLALSNNAHVAVLRALRRMTERLIVTGGGGYNPWSVARCWTRIWGEIAGQAIPDRLPAEAQEILDALVWPGRAAGRNPPRHWFDTLTDPPRPGELRPEVTAGVDTLRARLPAVARLP
ncbi:acetoin utilization protein AcuC [Rhodobacter sp. NTK016B]|uniref:acetoin utilization protein AcuC n=1 Tax=Rhodobacter sp. NTK016B TaxID=2759676 RepID=UPI001A8FB2D8|nr:acetoin utilization protein AcuC [Rhodobacter sp. NTK016B]MBN8291444.1 acetoin utilization protein AcuC [Rhodobacter sp. NTK016B]